LIADHRQPTTYEEEPSTPTAVARRLG
jgi:hypothetical protein